MLIPIDNKLYNTIIESLTLTNNKEAIEKLEAEKNKRNAVNTKKNTSLQSTREKRKEETNNAILDCVSHLIENNQKVTCPNIVDYTGLCRQTVTKRKELWEQYS